MSVLHVFMQCQSASNHSHIEIKCPSVNKRNCTAGTPGDRPSLRGGHPGDRMHSEGVGVGGSSATVSEHQRRTVGVRLRTLIISEYLFISI